MDSRYHRIKGRVYELFEPSTEDDALDKSVNIFLVALILISVLAFTLETMPAFAQRHATLLHWFDRFSVSIFTIEYVLRCWSCTSQSEYRHPVWGRLRFASSALPLIDMLSILPFYLPMVLPMDLRVLRLLRIFRCLRVLKIVRYSESLRVLGEVFRLKRDALIVTAGAAGLLLYIASSIVYYAEFPAQPEKFPDIPSTIWWGVVTLTTVGYGDVYPITTVGKMLGGIIAFLGIGMFALPAGILGSGFVEVMQRRRENADCCPHCGRAYEKQATRPEEMELVASDVTD